MREEKSINNEDIIDKSDKKSPSVSSWSEEKLLNLIADIIVEIIMEEEE